MVGSGTTVASKAPVCSAGPLNVHVVLLVALLVQTRCEGQPAHSARGPGRGVVGVGTCQPPAASA